MIRQEVSKSKGLMRKYAKKHFDLTSMFRVSTSVILKLNRVSVEKVKGQVLRPRSLVKNANKIKLRKYSFDPLDLKGSGRQQIFADFRKAMGASVERSVFGETSDKSRMVLRNLPLSCFKEKRERRRGLENKRKANKMKETILQQILGKKEGKENSKTKIKRITKNPNVVSFRNIKKGSSFIKADNTMETQETLNKKSRMSIVKREEPPDADVQSSSEEPDGEERGSPPIIYDPIDKIGYLFREKFQSSKNLSNIQPIGRKPIGSRNNSGSIICKAGGSSNASFQNFKILDPSPFDRIRISSASQKRIELYRMTKEGSDSSFKKSPFLTRTNCEGLQTETNHPSLTHSKKNSSLEGSKPTSSPISPHKLPKKANGKKQFAIHRRTASFSSSSKPAACLIANGQNSPNLSRENFSGKIMEEIEPREQKTSKKTKNVSGTIENKGKSKKMI